MSLSLKKLTPRVAVGSLCSPLEVGAKRAPAAASELARSLAEAGCEIVPLGPVDTPEKAVAAGYRCQYGPLDNSDILRQAMVFLRAAALNYSLRRARIGFGGYRVAGMTEVSVNEIALKRAIGARVVPLDIPLLLERAKEIPEGEARSLWEQVTNRTTRCKVSAQDGLDSIQVYLAVKELVDNHRLDALTIGCYPHLMGRTCLAASLLADEGIALGCEGGVNGAVAQLILTRLTGQPTHNTDFLEPLEDGTVVFTHCGSGSFQLAEDPKQIILSPVRLMGEGVCALFPAKPGPVTLVSLLPKGDGYQFALLEGEAVSTSMVFPGNPLRVRFPQPTHEIIDWIFDEGIGHHWMAGYGHVGNEIREWARACSPALGFLVVRS